MLYGIIVKEIVKDTYILQSDIRNFSLVTMKTFGRAVFANVFHKYALKYIIQCHLNHHQRSKVMTVHITNKVHKPTPLIPSDNRPSSVDVLVKILTFFPFPNRVDTRKKRSKHQPDY